MSQTGSYLSMPNSRLNVFHADAGPFQLDVDFVVNVQKYAINVDGPALHAARSAIENAKLKRALGGVFSGFGQLDYVLNGIARILWFHRSKLTNHQRTILNFLHQGLSQAEIADRLRVSRQNISKQVASSGWVPYSEAEKSWRIILSDYVDPLMGAGNNDPHRN